VCSTGNHRFRFEQQTVSEHLTGPDQNRLAPVLLSPAVGRRHCGGFVERVSRPLVLSTPELLIKLGPAETLKACGLGAGAGISVPLRLVYRRVGDH
jgi:hypothetical protein